MKTDLNVWEKIFVVDGTFIRQATGMPVHAT
jgi:hypothetical protein